MRRENLFTTSSFLVLYCLSIVITGSVKPYFTGSTKNEDLIERVFGGLRTAVADWSYMKAEEYHHNGISFLKAMEHHKGESSFDVKRAKDGGEHEEEDEHADTVGHGIFSKIYPNLRLTYESELTEAEEKEVLPWFYLEVKFNPHDIRGYVLGGYWLSRIDKEKAAQFLMEGAKNNPDSAQIYSSLGGLYLGMNRVDDAEIYLEKARQLWNEAKVPNIANDKYSQSDRFAAFELLADIHAKRREYKKAAIIYGELFYLDHNKRALEQLLEMKGKAEAQEAKK